MIIKHQNSNIDSKKQIPLLEKNDISTKNIMNVPLNPNKDKCNNNFNKQFYGNNYWDRYEYDDKIQQQNREKKEKKNKLEQESRDNKLD